MAQPQSWGQRGRQDCSTPTLISREQTMEKPPGQAQVGRRWGNVFISSAVHDFHRPVRVLECM